MQTLLDRKLQKTIKRKNDTIRLKNGSTFTGLLLDDIPNGEGIYTLSDGSYYKGNFKNGDLNGEGEFFISFTNLKFKGGFLNGEKHGFGIIEKENYTFEGNFQNGKKHGKFVEVSKGIVREGEYFEDYLKGQVKEYDKKTGEVFFEGFLKNGKKEKKCFVKNENYQFVGNFENNFFEGEGDLLIYPDNLEYSGEFKMNQPLIKANKFEIFLFSLKPNKKGEEEINEIKNIKNGFKIEVGKKYFFEIKIYHQGEDIKNPEFNETLKNKNKVSEFIPSEPILITQESGRKFKYLVQEEEKIYDIDFEKEFIKSEKKEDYEIDFEKDLIKTSGITKKGELKIDNFVLPKNFYSGSYKLIFKDVTNFYNNEFFHNLGEICLDFEIVGQKKKKK